MTGMNTPRTIASFVSVVTGGYGIVAAILSKFDVLPGAPVNWVWEVGATMALAAVIGLFTYLSGLEDVAEPLKIESPQE